MIAYAQMKHLMWRKKLEVRNSPSAAFYGYIVTDSGYIYQSSLSLTDSIYGQRDGL